MFPTIVVCADQVVARLKQAISEGDGLGDVLMKDEFTMFTLDVISKVRMSCVYCILARLQCGRLLQ